MKRSVYILILFTITWANSQRLFAQNKITQTELLGKWTLIHGSGGDFDKTTIGSTFDYQPTGITLIELMPIDKENPEDSKGKATWSFDGKVIKLGLMDEENKVEDTIEMTVTKYVDNKLYATTKRDNLSLVFEKSAKQ